MVNSFNELINARKKYLEGVRANDGFENGIRNLLSNMYPDEAHFIYELLQNAEDKKARNVNFKLYNDYLLFEHDGGIYDKTQLFNLKDIESITNIGKSTKSDDNTSIGKFGVGFKAVFAYTETPKIYSGDYAFQIQDLILPQIIEKEELTQGITKFIFPFNSNTKSKKDSFDEIKNGLLNIKDNTLLFLKNIESIKYEVFNGTNGEYLRVDEENNLVTLIAKNKETKWLRFDKQVKIEDEEDKKIKDCTINIAFKLDNDNFNKQLKIVPTNAGVSIYFPAEKETSNLNFILNAPFASTVARDSVRNCSSNRKLILELAILTEESLEKIKEYGYMNAEFLKVLPNKTSGVTDLYKPIWDTIIKAYTKNAYFPTNDNKLEYLKNIIRGGNSLQNFLSTDDLEFLLCRNNIYWLKNPPQLNQSIDNFYKQFDIKEYNRLYDILFDNIYSIDYPINDLIKTKDDNWVYSFFNELTDCHYSNSELSNLKRLNIFKLDNGSFSNPIKENIYLYSETNNELVHSFNILSKVVYTYLRKNQYLENSDIIYLLNDLGIHTYNIVDKVEEIIKKYNSNCCLTNEEVIDDIKLIIIYYKTKNSVALFKEKHFIKNTNGSFSKPNELILSEPYEETFYTKASFILEDLNLNAISSIYKNNLSQSECIDFINLLKDCNITYQFKIEEFGYDFYIENFEKFLSAGDQELSLEIYNFFTKEINDFFDYAYSGYGKIRDDSSIVKSLKEIAWLPNKQGVFKKPSEITRNELPSEFLWNDKNHFLTIIGLGKQDEKNEEFDKQLKATFGKTNSEIQYALAVTKLVTELGYSEDDLRQQVNKKKKEEALIPDKKLNNPEKRKKKNIEEIIDSPEKSYTKKEVSSKDNQNLAASQGYLKNHYFNIDNDTMFCQICHQNMPFKKKNGDWYFETVEIFNKNTFKKEDYTFYLSLCPVCSARYKEYVKIYSKSKEYYQLKNIKNDILMGINPINIEMDISATIQFSNQHLQDLKDKLEYLKKEEDDADSININNENNEQDLEADEIVEYFEEFENNVKIITEDLKNNTFETTKINLETKNNDIDDTEADQLGWD